MIRDKIQKNSGEVMLQKKDSRIRKTTAQKVGSNKNIQYSGSDLLEETLSGFTWNG